MRRIPRHSSIPVSVQVDAKYPEFWKGRDHSRGMKGSGTRGVKLQRSVEGSLLVLRQRERVGRFNCFRVGSHEYGRPGSLDYWLLADGHYEATKRLSLKLILSRFCYSLIRKATLWTPNDYCSVSRNISLSFVRSVSTRRSFVRPLSSGKLDSRCSCWLLARMRQSNERFFGALPLVAPSESCSPCAPPLPRLLKNKKRKAA